MSNISIEKLKNMNTEMNEMDMNTFVYFENDLQENIKVGTYGSTLLASDYSNRMVMPLEFIDSSTLKCQVYKFDYDKMNFVETTEVEEVKIHLLTANTLNANYWANHGDKLYFLSNGVVDSDEVLSIWAHDEVGVGEKDHRVQLDDVLFTQQYINDVFNGWIGKSLFVQNSDLENNHFLALLNEFKYDVSLLGKLSSSLNNVGENKYKLVLSFSEVGIEIIVTLEFDSFVCDKFLKETKQYVIIDTNITISY